MTDQPTDRQIDQLVKARLLEIGLSQTDLAELLNAAFAPTPKDGKQPAAIDLGRLNQVAKVLDVPAALLRDHDGTAIADQAGQATAGNPESQASLLQLRLLRAFCKLSDQRAQRTLVHLAEQLVKRQAARPGDRG
jgi:transcriptional regulator with XRE-family HTH domain